MQQRSLRLRGFSDAVAQIMKCLQKSALNVVVSAWLVLAFAGKGQEQHLT